MINPAIYTIAKNEAHNVSGFMEMAGDCPVYVLDTGSEDDTVELLKKHGAIVEQKIIDPWRFDTARNESLKLVPQKHDVCLSIDLDERIVPSNWQERLAEEWDGNLGLCVLISDWLDEARTKPGVQSQRQRIHERNGFEWSHAVHEVITPSFGTEVNSCKLSLVIHHNQDDKPRNYIPVLESAVKKNPMDSRSWLQLGAEYSSAGQLDESASAYFQFLFLTKDESYKDRFKRSHARMALARCFFERGNHKETIRQYLFAVAEQPDCREAWTHLAHLMLQVENAEFAYGCASNAEKIKSFPDDVAIETGCWGDIPEQIMESAAIQMKGVF